MKETNFNRRYLLSALGATGLASATGIVGFAAWTRDSIRYTYASTHNEGDVTLEAEWRETLTRNEETTVLEDTRVQPKSNGAIISLSNVLPDDRGTISFRLEVADDSNDSDTNDTSLQAPIEPQLSLNIISTPENGRNDPERKAGDTSPDGELQEFLATKLWYDEGLMEYPELGGDNAVQDPMESLIVSGDPDSKGTLEEVASVVDDVGLGCLDTGDTRTVSFSWEFDPDASPRDINVTQTDGVEFEFEITAVSC